MKQFIFILIMILASVANADWLGTFDIDEYVPIHITTSQFTTGALLTTANAQYRIYEETNGTFSTTEVVGPTALTMNFDGQTGLHVGSVQLSAANTFEVGKSYVIFVEATVDSVVAGTSHGFRIRAVSLAIASVQLSATAAGNLEDTYDGTGYADDVAPATQVQVSTLAGGIALRTAATGINIDEPNGGEQTLTYAATTTHDGSYHEVASDDAGNDIDFYYTFNTGDGDNLPVDFHFVGYYEDNNAPASSTMVIQVYDFSAVTWVTITTLTDSSGDITLDLPLNVHDVDPSGGTEGEVRIRFNLTTPEVTQNVRIDYVTVGFVSGAGGLTAAAVVDEWETQSQADPTGFHVNLYEVEGSDATTYIEGRTLATADYVVVGDTIAGVTLLNGLAANIITAASIAPNAIDASAIAPNAIDASAIAPNAIDADSIAPNAIDAATFAADVDAEIAAYILNAATNAYGGAGTYGQAIEDTLADTNAVDNTTKMRTFLTGADTPVAKESTLTSIEGKVDTMDGLIDAIKARWDALTTTGGLLEVVHGNI
ncbi:MAG TPA: hypothetical protein ENI05_02220 [Porticoccus sp.]|nr:hypothetical protein [Porticoccus sp.]